MILIEFCILCIMSFFRALVVFVTGRYCIRCENLECSKIDKKYYCKANKKECEKHILKPYFKRKKLRDVLNE